MDVEGFVEMTKKYTENITQSKESKQDTARGGEWDWNDLTALDKAGTHTHSLESSMAVCDITISIT